MSTLKTKVLQKAFQSFQKRLVSLLSIESALRLRYPFGDHYNFDKAMLSKSLDKLHPEIDSMQDPATNVFVECTPMQDVGRLFLYNPRSDACTSRDADCIRK
jgi:hypothetical protein